MAEEDILRLGIDSRPAEEGGRRYVRTLDEVRAASGRAAGSTDDLERRFRGLAAGAAGLATLAAGKLTQSWTGFRAIARGVGSQLVDLTQIGLRGVAIGLRSAADGMRDANGELTLLGKTTAVASKGVDTAASVLEKLARIAFGVQLAVGAAAVATGVLAYNAAAKFAPAWNRVLTLLGEGDWDGLRSEVSGLAGDLGVDGVAAAEAFYQILSAMPQLAQRPTEAVAILGEALSVSATGFASATEAASAITGVLNAFSLDASQATEVSNALYKAQGLGVTTFGEIASSIDRVSGLAASLGVDFTELLAITSTATSRLNTDTATVMTQLRAVMGNVLRPSAAAAAAAEELGVQFNAAAIEAKGLDGFLLDLIETTGGRSEDLAKFFGSQEALALVVGLANHTDRLTEDMRAYAKTGGEAARISDQMNGSWTRQKEILADQFAAELRNIGFAWEEMGASALKATNEIVEEIRKVLHWERELRRETALGNPIAFMNRAAEQYNAVPEISTLPTVRVTGTRPRRPDPFARPLEPIGLEFSTQKVREFAAAQKAAATLTLIQTGNIEEYRAALARSEEAVNDLVLAEVARNREAGESASVLNQIIALYNAETEAVRELERALADLDERLKSIDISMADPQGFDPSRILMPGQSNSKDRLLKVPGPAGYDTLGERARAEEAAREASERATEQFIETTEAVREITSGIGDLAGALDEVSPALAQVLRGIETLATGASRIRAGNAAGGTLGALGAASGALSVVAGLAQVIGGLRDSSRAAREEMRRITRAMDDWRRSIEGSTPMEDGLIAARDRLQEVAGIQLPDWADTQGEINDLLQSVIDARIAAGKDVGWLIEALELFNAALTKTAEEVQAAAEAEAERAAEVARQRESERRVVVDDLSVRALFAQGLDAEGTARQFAISQQRELQEALEKWGETNPELVAQIEEVLEMERQYRAEQKRLAQEAFRQDLEVRRLSALGLDDQAADLRLQLQQQREIADARRDGMSEGDIGQLVAVQAMEKRAMQEERQRQVMIDAIEEQTRTFVDGVDEQLEVSRETLRSSQDQARTLERSIEVTRRAVESLRGYASGLSLNDQLSTLGPMEQLKVARSEYESVLSRAKTGDLDAAGDLQGAAGDYLSVARDVFASNPGYVAIFDQVKAGLLDVASRFENQVTVEERMLATLQNQVTLLEDQIARLQASKEQAQADAQRQIDATKGVAETYAQWTSRVLAELAASVALDREAIANSSATGIIKELQQQRLDNNVHTAAVVSRLIEQGQLAREEIQVLLNNRNSLLSVSQKQIDAVNGGASQTHLDLLDQISRLERARFDSNANFFDQISKLREIGAIDDETFQQISAARQEADTAYQNQINALYQQIAKLEENTKETTKVKDATYYAAEQNRIAKDHLNWVRHYGEQSWIASMAMLTWLVNISNKLVEVDNNLHSQNLNYFRIPAYATGGYHEGGLRIVGERGPEIEDTGPSRIYSSNRIKEMFGPATAREDRTEELLEELRAQNRGQKAEVRVLQSGFSALVERVEKTNVALEDLRVEVRRKRN